MQHSDYKKKHTKRFAPGSLSTLDLNAMLRTDDLAVCRLFNFVEPTRLSLVQCKQVAGGTEKKSLFETFKALIESIHHVCSLANQARMLKVAKNRSYERFNI